MELTTSYEDVFNPALVSRYLWLETREAAAVLKASSPEEFEDLRSVLESFYIYDSDILTPGGNRGPVSIRIDAGFERLGWRAVRINMRTLLEGKAKKSNLKRGDYLDLFLTSEVSNDGYEVDNMKRKAAVDVEWNGKDGALDRDTGAYRALYDLGLISVATIITRDHEGIKKLAGEDLHSDDAVRRLGTSTTTNMHKLRDRMVRGDAGGAPLLAVGITRATWAGAGVPAPELTGEAAEAVQLDAVESLTGDPEVAGQAPGE